MRKIGALGRILKGLYNILAGYLLAWILLFALASLGLQALLGLVAGFLEFDSVDQLWVQLSSRTGQRQLYLRLAAASLIHLSWLLLLRKPIWRVWQLLERGITALERGLERLGSEESFVRRFFSTTFTVAVTALLVPFVIQPTLVSNDWDGRAWAVRAANLVDGTASSNVVESVVGLYRRMGAPPVRSQGSSGGPMDVIFPEDDGQVIPIQDGGITARPPPRGPLMDRWDPVIRQVAGKDRHAFALLKALIWVESGGRQFAVSRTGCVGLTQFCSRTARSRPYRAVFGLGQVYPCSCRNGGCDIPRSVALDLESGDMARLIKHKATFPCDLSDARFEPDKAIAAAWLYAQRMLRAYGNNIYLFYIGYNSGPGVASRVWSKAGRQGGVGLAKIDDHLASALRPHFGDSSEARAKSLVTKHLPKLKAAYIRYYQPAPTSPAPPNK